MATLKIPAWIAIVINANIVIGSAFFLGAGRIAALNGALAPVAWLLCGLILLPLVIVFARLAMLYPQAGGLYVYSQKQLGTLWGFISGWGYYIGVIAANAAVLHAFSTELQKIATPAYFLNSLGLTGMRFDVFLVLVFTIVNLFNIEFLERAQIVFAILKSIPLLLVLVSLPFLFNGQNLATAPVDWSSLFTTIPWVFFAFIGIEACCAITDKIQDGQKNAGRVILTSFAIIMAIYTILQFALLCIHGAVDNNPFLTILPKLTNNPTIIQLGSSVLSFALLSSFLGGFYGMFYYNNWNLFVMGQERSILFSRYLTLTNKGQVPWVCVLVQSALVLLLLTISNTDYYLVTIGDFGTAIAYLLSVASFLRISRSFVGFCALASCFILMYICADNLLSSGIYNIVPFILIILGGVAAHALNHWTQQK